MLVVELVEVMQVVEVVGAELVLELVGVVLVMELQFNNCIFYIFHPWSFYLHRLSSSFFN